MLMEQVVKIFTLDPDFDFDLLQCLLKRAQQQYKFISHFVVYKNQLFVKVKTIYHYVGDIQIPVSAVYNELYIKNEHVDFWDSTNIRLITTSDKLTFKQGYLNTNIELAPHKILVIRRTAIYVIDMLKNTQQQIGSMLNPFGAILQPLYIQKFKKGKFILSKEYIVQKLTPSTINFLAVKLYPMPTKVLLKEEYKCER